MLLELEQKANKRLKDTRDEKDLEVHAKLARGEDSEDNTDELEESKPRPSHELMAKALLEQKKQQLLVRFA